MKLSVIICTHNPRRDHLNRMLASLQAQTYHTDNWELVLIDNASNPPLEEELDLSWHPKARIISEPTLGILPARVRGIQEAQADLLLFVDDDNLLEPNYLETALEIGETHPFLGCWGGQLIPEFEETPPDWIDRFKLLLACVEIPRDRWSNFTHDYSVLPPTAGMCLRREIAEEFIRLVETDSRRQLLGRRGKKGLTNCEDTDLALTACDLGFGNGQFVRLKLTHLIPASRLDRDYVLRFAESSFMSSFVLRVIRGEKLDPHPSAGPGLRPKLGSIRRRLMWDRARRELYECELRGYQRACELVADW